MTEGVRGDLFIHPGRFGSIPNGFLKNGFIEMVTSDEAGIWVHGTLGGGKDKLPRPLFGGVDVFDIQSVGKDGFAVSLLQVPLVKRFYILEHLFQFGDEAFREDG